MALISSEGRVRLLRVNERGDRFGPRDDNITAEVIVQLEGDERNSYGFRLLDDDDLPVRRGYLALLRDALNHGHIVHLNSEVDEGTTKGRITRIWLTRAPRPRPGILGGEFVDR